MCTCKLNGMQVASSELLVLPVSLKLKIGKNTYRAFDKVTLNMSSTLGANDSMSVSPLWLFIELSSYANIFKYGTRFFLWVVP